jgi:hypothetical protein
MPELKKWGDSGQKKVTRCLFWFTWMHWLTPYHWRNTFGDLALDEREGSLKITYVTLFFLCHGAHQDCYGKGTDRKLAPPVPKCAGKHAKWLHKSMTKERTYHISMNAASCAEKHKKKKAVSTWSGVKA